MSAAMDDFNATSSAFRSTVETAVPSLEAGLIARVVSSINAFSVLFTIIAVAVAYDQMSYWRQKGSITGPAWKMPFIGPFLESVDPKFEKYYAKWLSGSLSCVSVFHKFVIIASTRDVARQILNAPAYVKPCVVDVAHKLLRPENWVFLDGKAHVEYRKGLNGLFTRQALATYLPGQQEVYEEYFKSFLAISDAARKSDTGAGPDKGGEKFVYPLRELMCAVSCRTFVGHYMSPAQVKVIADDYYNITAALELVNFPIILPFTRTWYGKKAADKVLEAFASCAAKSKIRMKQPGARAECIMDRWVEQMIASERYRERIARDEKVPDEQKPAQVLRQFTDFEISMTVLTFLFASQDATSSACSWLLQSIADHPETLVKVREEGQRLMGNRYGRYGEVTIDDLDNMHFTRACVKETLRYRPPVIMVPYVVKKAYPVTPTYTAPKNSMIIPSTWLSLHDNEAYPSHGGADVWAPERWTEGNAEDQGKNWLVFGTGPHYCLGQTYAVLNLMVSRSSRYNGDESDFGYSAHAPPAFRKFRLAPHRDRQVRRDPRVRNNLSHGK